MRIPLESLPIFAEAARCLSFQDAATALNLTPSAVSQRIRTLEDRLGCRLFRRMTRQVVLTEEGQLLYQRLRLPLAEIETALSTLRQPEDRPVTVSTTASFAQECLLPVLGAFQLERPDVRVKLLVENTFADLAGGKVDIAVRQGMGDYPGLDSQLLIAGRYVPVLAPALADRALRVPLIQVAWPGQFADPPVWASWQARSGIVLQGPVAMTVPFESVAIQAALAGHGMALVHRDYVRRYLARGELVQPFGPSHPLPTSLSHYLLRARRPLRPHAQALWLWLQAAFSADPVYADLPAAAGASPPDPRP